MEILLFRVVIVSMLDVALRYVTISVILAIFIVIQEKKVAV